MGWKQSKNGVQDRWEGVGKRGISILKAKNQGLNRAPSSRWRMMQAYLVEQRSCSHETGW